MREPPTSTRAGASRSTSATRPPSTGPRSSGSGSRRFIAAPSNRRLHPARAGLTGASCVSVARVRSARRSLVLGLLARRSDDVLDVEGRPGAVEGDADGVEADLSVAGERRAARPSRRWRGGASGAACAGRSRGPGARGRSRTPSRPALTSTKTSVGAVEGDDVELAEAGAGVALEDPPARGRQSGGDEILGAAAGSLAREGHAESRRRRDELSPARSQRICDLRATRRRYLPSVLGVLATARTFTLDGICCLARCGLRSTSIGAFRASP